MGAKMLVHKWRSEVQSIMIGTKTARNDNPGLNVREWTGKSPLRIVLDRILTLPQNLKLFDQSIPTYVITEKKDIADKPNTTFIRMNFNDDLIPNLFRFLYQKGIQSLFVEGGACLLQSVIDSGLWNEARVFVGDVFFSEGIQAPKLKTPPTEKIRFDKSSLFIFKNTTTS
jgi:diaminohydroxyphosphoribosylaminopyrimidine deaminase/5-amino-6-(5-phosphoribosylamino)uracil reductase